MKNLSPDNILLLKQITDAKAIITSSTIYTYSELREKVLQRASILKSQNISSGNFVAIIGNNDMDFVIDVLALWQLSATPVPINTKLNEKDILDQLTLADCNSLIVAEEYLEKVKNTNRKLVRSDVHSTKQNFEIKELSSPVW